MRYGRLTEGRLQQAPNPILDGALLLGNPPAERYAALGWLPVTETPCPEQAPEPGFFWEACWSEEAGVILQSWTQTELPPEGELPDGEALEILLGGAT